MGKPSPPAAPDPQATIAAQTASNQSTATANANLNRVDQYTPYGNSIYNVTGNNPDGTPHYSQTTSLSPEQQNLYNMGVQGQTALGKTALGQLGNLQSAYANPFSFGGPQVTGQVANPDYSAQIKQAQDAAYNSQTQYLDPQFAEQGDQLNARLANQGLQVGDRAYDTSQDQFSRGKQAAYQSARDAATQAGNQEQNVLFGQDLSKANLQNSASAQALSQALGLYNQPLNSYNALASGSQVTNPSFSSIPVANQANTDVGGITNSSYQNQLAAYKQSQSGLNNLFSLGGSVLGGALSGGLFSGGGSAAGAANNGWGGSGYYSQGSFIG